MSPRRPAFRDPRRSLALAAVLALGVVTAIGSGGGGGGDDGGGLSDEPAPPFPSRVTYAAGNPADFGGSGVNLALAGGGTARAGFFLEGSYTRADRGYTLAPHSAPRINVTTSGLPYALPEPDFGIRVEQTMQWAGGAQPTSGVYTTATPNFVRLTVVPDVRGTGLPGVDIEQVDFGTVTGTASLTWAELDAVLDNPAAFAGFVVQAAFAESVRARVFDQVQVGLDGIEFVTANDAALTAAGDGVGLDRTCDPFPLSGTTGTFHFTWNDGPGEFPAALGAGDHFGVTYDDCWRDRADPADDLWLQSGTAELSGYSEDPLTIALGFDAVVLRNMVETVTREAGGSHTPVDTATVDSFGVGTAEGFRLATEPDLSGAIHAANALDVASAAVEALRRPREVGDLALAMLTGALGDAAFDPCDLGGTFAITPAPLPGMTAPVAFDLAFTACAIGGPDPATYDGTATLTLDSLGGTLGTLLTGDYSVGLTAFPIDVDTTDAIGISTLTGGTGFARTAVAGNLAELGAAVAAADLSTIEDGVTAVLSAYSVASTLASGGTFTLGAAGDTLTLDPGTGTGPLTITVLQAVQGTDPASPATGTLRIEAADGATLTLTVASGMVTLELDANGDGTVDDTRTVPWDAVA